MTPYNKLAKNVISMLNLYMKRTCYVLLMAFSLVFSSVFARAGGDENDGRHGDGEGQDENCQGGEIDGSESLIAFVDLVATDGAPAGAGGYAQLISDNEDGVVTSSLNMVITGLDAGVYVISVVKKSDGTTVDLGQVEIGNPGDGEGDDEESDGEKCRNWGVFISEDDLRLPDGLDPLDVAQILVSDSNGNVVLIGDLVTPTGATTVKFKANLRVRNGSVSLWTSGKARAWSTARKGRRTDVFAMVASGLSPSTTFTVKVNGKKAGMVKSNAKGKVQVGKLPANLLTVRSVQLITPGGQTAASLRF